MTRWPLRYSRIARLHFNVRGSTVLSYSQRTDWSESNRQQSDYSYVFAARVLEETRCNHWFEDSNLSWISMASKLSCMLSHNSLLTCFAGCILMERQAELESAILSMARRCVDQLRYWRIMEHRTCAAQAYSTLEVLWTAAVPTMHMPHMQLTVKNQMRQKIKTQFYVALSLSYRAMYGCARRNQTSDLRLIMQRELLYVPLSFG